MSAADAGIPAAAARAPVREAAASGNSAGRVLLIAFHYPPCGISSGLQRTLCFSRDLCHYGWAPSVLTVHTRAYPAQRSDQLAQVPPEVPVRRAFALDTTRHLGFRGRYLGWMALPDPWITWLIGAIPAGLRMIRKHKSQVLWSTYPMATAHLVGLALHWLTGIPWVADFRDPMTEIDPITHERFPVDPRLWNVRRWIEAQTLKYSARAVFVTPGSLRLHQARYPRYAKGMTVIANGYDEANFAEAEQLNRDSPAKPGPLLLLHSGVLYPGPDRDPTAFFDALSKLRKEGKVSRGTLRVRLRASGYEDYYGERLRQFGVDDMVSLEPAIPYQAALAEMLAADGLLVFQGATSNPAVPAKLYEYLRARRPIFALVDSGGETASVLRQAGVGASVGSGVGSIVPLDRSDTIAEGLQQFLSQVREGSAPLPDPQEVERHSREHKARELGSLLNQVLHDVATNGNAVAATERNR